MSRPQTSTRDLDELRRRLQDWLAKTLPVGADPEVLTVEAPSTNGMSSETLLFDATWREGGDTRAERLVARVAPEAAAVPVFPVYDLDRQYQVIRLVGEHSSVPVPTTYWSEPDEVALGAPFFVMERVEGVVPPDVMPYNFGGNWLSEASQEDQSRLQESSVAVLAELHQIPDAAKRFSFLEIDRSEPTALARHVGDQWSFYEWAWEGQRSPLLERCFAWLHDHWPTEESPSTLNWGDSRIGNTMYRDFEPVAVLDWEMASVGPAEIDVAWFIFLHRFFEDLAATYDLAGMPDFLRREDVAASYESLVGTAPRDLDWYLFYAAVRHGIVMSRTQRRAIHFGEATMPDDVDDLILHRATLEKLLAGSYWD